MISKVIIFSAGLFSFVLLGGCAHSHPRGTVVLKDSPKEGHVCIEHDKIAPGDTVKVFKNKCKTTSVSTGRHGSRSKTSCEKQLVGEGRIIESSNEHFAKIEALGDLNLEEGFIVEKSPN